LANNVGGQRTVYELSTGRCFSDGAAEAYIIRETTTGKMLQKVVIQSRAIRRLFRARSPHLGSVEHPRLSGGKAAMKANHRLPQLLGTERCLFPFVIVSSARNELGFSPPFVLESMIEI
jgi:hypothetical protein